jgi:hypothetical protein
MKKIFCLALPALMAAGCGDDTGTWPGAPRVDGGRDVSPDVPATDAPGTPDAYVLPDAPSDRGVRLDAPPIDTHTPIGLDAPYDAPPAVDGPAIDGPRVDGPGVDAPLSADHPEPTVLDAPVVDGPRADTETVDARTVTWPDGRVLTVVKACQYGLVAGNSSCPPSYAEGLAKVLAAADGGSPTSRTGAGRCAEGSYLYAPYIGSSTRSCYYDATTQLLIGDVSYYDIYVECSGTDTVSRALVYGTEPPCTTITWDAYVSAY